MPALITDREKRDLKQFLEDNKDIKEIEFQKGKIKIILRRDISQSSQEPFLSI